MKVAILIADGFEQVEMTEPRKALDEAGADTSVVSLKPGRVRAWKFVEWGEEFPVDITLEHADPASFEALLLPGGVINPDTLRVIPKAVSFAKHFFNCESALKWDPTSDRPRPIEIFEAILLRVGGPNRRRSGPPTSGVSAGDFSDLLLLWPGSLFSADSHRSGLEVHLVCGSGIDRLWVDLKILNIRIGKPVPQLAKSLGRRCRHGPAQDEGLSTELAETGERLCTWCGVHPQKRETAVRAWCEHRNRYQNCGEARRDAQPTASRTLSIVVRDATG